MSIFTSVIKCGICGEPLSGAGNPYTCAVCGNVSYTSNPMLEDELRTANAMRECTRFDEAMLVYKQIVKKYKSDDLSEVYWNLLLCEQRVMFETDEKGERFPSFYAIVSDDVEDSPYYTCALSAAEKHAPERVAIFTEMAEKMARAKQLYARIRESEKPYDVFICFKKSKLDGSGEETPDTDLAEDLYNQFAKDYRIFFSERTLRDVAVRDFEPNIYYALYTAKVLLLLCSKREYIDSKWVKNEWSRYHAMAQNPATGKTVIPVFLEDFEPGNLPAELLSYQGLADGRQLMGALESTLRKILKPLDMEAELNRRMQEMMEEMMKVQAAPSMVVEKPVFTPTVTSEPVINSAQESAEEQYRRALNYQSGNGVEQSDKKAAQWFAKAAEQGHAAAQNELGSCYEEGQGVEQSYEKAVYWYTKAAEQGDADAQTNLGFCYEQGYGVKQSYKTAVRWYTEAAEQGAADAQTLLGCCYYNGEGVEQSYEKAVYWCTKAAQQGAADAQTLLGSCYYNGQGVEQSNERAVYWYTKAAEQGNADAQANLGFCYYQGDGVGQSYEKAVYWYTKAAEQGNADAQTDLGFCYYSAYGVKQSYSNAVYWFTQAAKQGQRYAQCGLGVCYENGEGVKKSYEQAIHWYTKAAEQGLEIAEKNLKKLTKKQKRRFFF